MIKEQTVYNAEESASLLKMSRYRLDTHIKNGEIKPLPKQGKTTETLISGYELIKFLKGDRDSE